MAACSYLWSDTCQLPAIITTTLCIRLGLLADVNRLSVREARALETFAQSASGRPHATNVRRDVAYR